MFFKAFIHPEKLSLGVDISSGVIHYALVYIEKTGKNVLIKSGNHLPGWLRLLFPLNAHASLGHVPTSISVSEIALEDPDTWIEHQEVLKSDNKEEKKSTITEYFVDNKTVYQVQAAIDACNTKYKQLHDIVDVQTLRPPLWDLAGLYWNEKKKPFVLWKISKEGSVIGFVDNGNLQKICNFWPDIDELWENPDEIITGALPLIRSMTQQKNLPVILFSPDNVDVCSLKFNNAEIKIEVSPSVKGIKIQDHEIYALALSHAATLNFVPFDKVQESKKIRSIWRGSVCAIRWFTIIILAILLVLWGTEEGLTLYEKVNHKQFSGITEQINNLKLINAKRDSVLTLFKEKARFLAEESTITSLLNGFQDVFPEGMYAEEISVTDSEDKKYRIDIRAIASSSSLIGVCMEKLQNVKGLTACRMVYSEQITTKNVNGIRVKIEAVWK